MLRVDKTGTFASAAFRLGLLAGAIAVAGCSGAASAEKSDDPALKASMKKQMEIYMSKTNLMKKKGPNSSQARKRYSYPTPTRPRA